jgi:Holliday junction resolvase RusA-like endonuclease
MRDDTPTVEAEAALSWHERDRDDPERWGVDEAAQAPCGVEGRVSETTLRFEVLGHPHPKARARTVVQKGKVMTFSPEANTTAETIVRKEALDAARAAGVALPVTDRLTLGVTFFVGTKARIDWDNLGKTVTDALNRHVIADDSQIDVVHLRVHRGVGKAHERTVVALRWGEP